MTLGINDKQSVAIHAANLVEEGMIVGLGTGSTANYFIEQLARRQQDEGLRFKAVASSIVSMNKALDLGLSLLAIEHIQRLDLYVDGADEVTEDGSLLKGRGFDLVKEKLLAHASEQFYVLIDDSKCVSSIGQNFPIPIEVSPSSWQIVLHSLQKIGGKGGLRKNATGDGLAITSHGSLVLDMAFDPSLDAETLNNRLNAIPGVIEHGIFYQLASHVFMVENNQVITR